MSGRRERRYSTVDTHNTVPPVCGVDGYNYRVHITGGNIGAMCILDPSVYSKCTVCWLSVCLVQITQELFIRVEPEMKAPTNSWHADHNSERVHTDICT